MSLAISLRFLTGRAHLHPWQTHHSEGRVEWPPSHWRLLRALVAVAGRGLTTLPVPDFFADPGRKPRKTKKNPNPAWPPEGFNALPDNFAGDTEDEIPLSRLAALLHALSATPTIWLPKSGGGHTRQYFPIHKSTVFDTFATVRKDQPTLFHWYGVDLNDHQLQELRLLLGRMTYFGRAESWCDASVHTVALPEIEADGLSKIDPNETHWECRCIDEDEHAEPEGEEYRDYLLERRLAPVVDLADVVPRLMPRTKAIDGNKREQSDAKLLNEILAAESSAKILLRCLLRESGQDIKDGLERPIGTRWVHYAVPRQVFAVPRAKPKPLFRNEESINLVRYALNTATVGRAVLPSITDTLLVADKFRSAAMALCGKPSFALSGHADDGRPSGGHRHAYWWPMDDDNDGFIDSVVAWAPGGFDQRDVGALRRLTRLRQRRGRPDLLVTPTFVGQAEKFGPWADEAHAATFVSATPYFCPVHLSHGRGRSGRIRSLKAQVIKSMKLHGVVEHNDEVAGIDEIVFDYAPKELAMTQDGVNAEELQPPIAPRQYFPVIEPPSEWPRLPFKSNLKDIRYPDASLKDADDGYCFGNQIGLRVADGTRFIRALNFCRRRRRHELKGRARMLRIKFALPRSSRPFAIGGQAHFGMGLFTTTSEFHELS